MNHENIRSSIIKLKQNTPYIDEFLEESERLSALNPEGERPTGLRPGVERTNDKPTQTVKKPFDRNEYMRNYMREYMRKKTQKQKQEKINEQQIRQHRDEVMKNAVELLIEIINVYSDSLSNESLNRISEVCDTKNYDISFILESLTNEISQSAIF